MAEVCVKLEVAAGRLPEICARCGAPATASKWKTMTWYPSWVNLLLLIGVLPAAIVAMILTKRASVKAPFCERHKWHWLGRNLLIGGSFVLLGVIGVGSIILAQNRVGNNDLFPFVCIGDLVLFVGWLVFVVIAHGTSVRPKRITNEEIVLAGVCTEFVVAVEEEEREIRLRKKRARRIADEEDEEEDDQPRPRSSRPSTDVQDSAPRPRNKRPPADEIEE